MQKTADDFDALDDTDDLDLSDERPLRRARRRLPWLRMGLFSGLCIAALAFLAQQSDIRAPVRGDGPVPASVLIAPAPDWRPLPAGGVAPYAFDKSLGPPAIESRQHASGGREDTLTFGSIGDGRIIRISLTQNVPLTPRSFFVDTVRRAAEAGLAVDRAGQTQALPTKFGGVEIAPVTLTGKSDSGKSELACQAFRFVDAAASFGFQGWLCGGDSGAGGQAQITCVLDSLTLVAGDGPLKALFARTERTRIEACGAGGRTASIGVKTPPARP